MKDYEAYRNNGNSEIKDNERLKKLDNSNLLKEINNLPGEYFDIRENQIECELEDSDKVAANPNESGNAEAKNSLDNVQDLTNAVNPGISSSGSIVESAGAIATGTATVVVGASAAVVAFNAVGKTTPKMVVNQLESGSSYVHYSLELSNLDLDKDYDIVVKNSQQEFRLECVNGINDEYVYNLKPGLQYSLSLVGYHELLGEIEYSSKTFYTLNSEEVLGYSIIDIVYNDDLTCGIKYSTTLVDDNNTISDTYIIVKELVDGFAEEEWEIFNSLYAEDFMREEPDKYTYSYKNKVHSGTIKEVYDGKIIVELYKKGISDDEEDDELISVTTKDVKAPLKHDAGANYIEFKGNYGLIKDIKKINIKKDNLVAKIVLYNEENVETKIERIIDITDNLFELRQLVKQDSKYYSYQVGYYKADNSFVVVKEEQKAELYGSGIYDAYYEPVFDAYDFEKMDIKWNYDSEDKETMDLKVITGFDNFGNEDCYYQVDLLKQINRDGSDPTYELVDTYIGTSDAIFYNVPTSEYDEAYDSNMPIFYCLNYTSIMNYYDENEGIVSTIVDTHNSDGNIFFFREDMKVNEFSGLTFRGDGTFAVSLDMDYEGGELPVGEFVNASMATLHFYKDDYNMITDTLTVTGAVAKWIDNYPYIIFNLDFPTDVYGSYITYEIYYREAHGNNIRRIKSSEMIMLGDLGYKVQASNENVTYFSGYANGEIQLVSYMPEGYTLKARITYDGVPEDVPIVDGKYVYKFEEAPLEQSIYVDVYDSSGNQMTNQAYSIYLNGVPNYDYEQGYVNFYTSDAFEHVTFTYNSDGTVNLYCDTGFVSNPDPTVDASTYTLDVYLEVTDDSLLTTLYTGSVTGLNDDNTMAIFENIPYVGTSTSYNFRYDYTSDTMVNYEARHRIVKVSGDGFSMFESNMGSMSAYFPNTISANIVADDVLGRNVIALEIHSSMIFDMDQTIRFERAFDADSDPEIIEVKLSDYFVEKTDERYYFKFDLGTDFVDGVGTHYLYINFNYTLTEENYDKIVDNYSGNLYKEYSVL